MNPFFSLVKKEFIHFFRDPIVAGLILYHFTACIILCGYSFILDSHHLKVAVYDMSRSEISRELTSRFFATEYFDLSQYVEDMDELTTLINSGEVQAALIFPEDFSRNIEGGKGGALQYIADGSNANMAGQGLGYASQILGNINRDLMLSEARRQGYLIDELPEVSNKIRFLYNQGVREVYFIVISHILVAGIIGGLMLSSTAVVREKELGTIDQLLVAPISIVELLLAKSIAPLIICMVATMFSFLVVFMFDVPLKGNVFTFLGFAALFISSMIGIGILLGSICNNMLQTILLSFLIWFPSSFLSGVITPIDNMLPAIKAIANALPATHFMTASNGIFQKGLGFSDLIPEAIILSTSAIVLFSIGASITWWKLR